MKTRKNYKINLLNTSKLSRQNFRKSLTTLIVLGVVAFAIMLLLFRGSIRKLSEDDSVFMINNNTAFKIVQIMNINKNLFADQLKECWNQQNPHIGCSDENEIVPGTYILKNGDNLSWIDGPHSGIITDKIFKLSEREVRDSMHGFMRNDLNYYQQINISYTGQDSENEAMEIEITTINDDGDKSVKNIRSTRY